CVRGTWMPGTADKPPSSAAGHDEPDHLPDHGTGRGPDIARLRIAIDEVTPAVIRHVEVPITIRLDDLHFVLPIAIGWKNGHPFEFRVDDGAADAKVWGLVDRDDPDSTTVPAETATLADLLALGHTFRYDYVYGEDWGHVVALEAITPAAPAASYPHLV